MTFIIVLSLDFVGLLGFHEKKIIIQFDSFDNVVWVSKSRNDPFFKKLLKFL